MHARYLLAVSAVFLFGGLVSASGGARGPAGERLPPWGTPVVGKKPPMPEQIELSDPPYRVTIWISGLVEPWDIAFVSSKRAYVTERPGRVRLIENGKLRPRPYTIIKSAYSGEGGLMGIAIHPQYPHPAWVYPCILTNQAADHTTV